MRVLILHGYLLRGTGSNVYTAQLARALGRQGHEVHVVCQERRAEELAFVDAVGDWDGPGGAARLRTVRTGGGVTVWRAPLPGGVLPVYVADAYEGVRAVPLTELDDAAVAAYVDGTVAAVRDVVARTGCEIALAGHLVLAPAVLARAAAVPYAVKVHGSALEYTVKVQPGRFGPWAAEGLAPARAVLVGSRHTAESLWAAMGDPALAARTRLGPPGVDVEAFAPAADPAAARAGVRALAADLAAAAAAPAPAATGSSFDRDVGEASRALARLERADGPLVAYVGKLIVSKGVDLLAAAWPLVLARAPGATLAVVGFGAYRPAFERLLAALAAGDFAAVAALAREGRAAEGGPAAPLHHLEAFLAGLRGAARDAYVAAARALPERVVLTGRLEHAELTGLLPACAAQVVPSTFPEAFGMVAAEAAACGTLPIVAGHSGLAEVADALAPAVPGAVRPLLRFAVGPEAVPAIAERVTDWLATPAPVRAQTTAALVRVARERFSWEGVARGVLAAAQGRVDELPAPRPLD